MSIHWWKSFPRSYRIPDKISTRVVITELFWYETGVDIVHALPLIVQVHIPLIFHKVFDQNKIVQFKTNGLRSDCPALPDTLGLVARSLDSTIQWIKISLIYLVGNVIQTSYNWPLLIIIFCKINYYYFLLRPIMECVI